MDRIADMEVRHCNESDSQSNTDRDMKSFCQTERENTFPLPYNCSINYDWEEKNTHEQAAPILFAAKLLVLGAC